MISKEQFLLVLVLLWAPILKAQRDTLHFDHIVLFVRDKALEDTLTQRLFRSAEKLSSQHPSQGTVGHYVLFLNSSIEFLYLQDSTAAKANEASFRSAYVQRWNVGNNPIGIGLIADPFDPGMSGFRAYHSSDQPSGESYLMANGNKDLAQPLVYASMPHRAHRTLTTMEEIEDVDPTIREDLRYYLSHPSGIRRLTGVVLTLPASELGNSNAALLQGINGVEVRAGDHHGLTLVFDEGAQGKEFRWSNGVGLVIRY